MLFASICYGSRSRMSTWLPEPPSARSQWTAVDRFSDLDLTFGIDDHVPVPDVLTAQFRLAGPRFRLLFGETAAGESQVSAPPVAGDLYGALRAALAAPVRALMRASAEARLPHADTVAQRLAELR
jgi:hypothetical protein